jgi:hypothetical protein
MTTMTNKYRGTCAGCGTTVYPQEGVWKDGDVWCEAPEIYLGSLITCSRDAERQRIERDRGYEVTRGQQDRTYVSADPIAQERISAYWRHRDMIEADPEYQARQRARSERIERENAEWARQGLCRCERCGGAGGSDGWPGWACYDCGGSGAVLQP